VDIGDRCQCNIDKIYMDFLRLVDHSAICEDYIYSSEDRVSATTKVKVEAHPKVSTTTNGQNG
jgi:hypothetical protein